MIKLLVNPKINKKNKEMSPEAMAILEFTVNLLKDAMMNGIKGMSPKMAKLKNVMMLFRSGFSSLAMSCNS